MVLVTCASGSSARNYIPELLKKGLEIRALDINPAVENLKEIGVKEVIVGDMRDPQVRKQALEGIDKVLYVPPLLLGDEAQIGMDFVDSAIEAGVKQYVFMSVTHPNMTRLFNHKAKLLVEEHIVYKGLTHNLNYTILQPMHFTYQIRVGELKGNGTFHWPAGLDTKLGHVDARDVGEVAAKVLTEDTHRNASYELCSGDYLTTREIVDIYNKVTGENAVPVHIDPLDFMKMMNITDSGVRIGFLRLFEVYTDSGIAGNPNVLEWLLGRKPTSVEDYIRRCLKEMGQ